MPWVPTHKTLFFLSFHCNNARLVNSKFDLNNFITFHLALRALLSAALASTSNKNHIVVTQAHYDPFDTTMGAFCWATFKKPFGVRFSGWNRVKEFMKFRFSKSLNAWLLGEMWIMATIPKQPAKATINSITIFIEPTPRALRTPERLWLRAEIWYLKRG
jgi:hypothetical protein